MFRTTFLTVALGLAIAAPAAATTLNAGLSGTASLSQANPSPGQTFTLSGGFTSYVASANLPQITGGDLNQYSFTTTGDFYSFDATTRTAVYDDVVGTISGYGQVVQNLAPTTLTVTFDPTFATATVMGTLESTGPVTPPGFPGPIDFTPANGAQIDGVFTSNGPETLGGSFVGSITAVPEAATWAMMLLGIGALGAVLRRRRDQFTALIA